MPVFYRAQPSLCVCVGSGRSSPGPGGGGAVRRRKQVARRTAALWRGVTIYRSAETRRRIVGRARAQNATRRI